MYTLHRPQPVDAAGPGVHEPAAVGGGEHVGARDHQALRGPLRRLLQRPLAPGPGSLVLRRRRLREVGHRARTGTWAGPSAAARRARSTPTSLRDENGRRTLLFKNDGNEFQRPTSIWAQAMSEDGTSVSGKAKVIMRNDTKWEGGVIEGPSIVRARRLLPHALLGRPVRRHRGLRLRAGHRPLAHADGRVGEVPRQPDPQGRQRLDAARATAPSTPGPAARWTRSTTPTPRARAGSRAAR